MKRLPATQGEWIERDKPVRFAFEGKTYTGFQGDTISSALLANGVTVLGRSFKYHRPRSVLSMANHDVNAMMQDGSRANIRADATPLYEGAELSAVNTFGGLESDKASILGSLSRFLPVGFYYKSFHTRRLFPLWERMFRKLTGLGRVDFSEARIRTAKRYGFCDVLVIGGGTSGISAALVAANQGADVTIVDENQHLGGSGCYAYFPDKESRDAYLALAAKLLRHPRIQVMTSTVAAGYYADHWVPLVRSDHIVKMRARTIVVASGGFEQPAVFRNNDLPGIMLASAAQRLIHRYAIKPADETVVLTANSDGYLAALDMLKHGVVVNAIIDMRPSPDISEYEGELKSAGVPVHTGCCIMEAVPAKDGRSVRKVRISEFSIHDKCAQPAKAEFDCDGVLMSVGWAPAANLLYQAGTRMHYDKSLEQFRPSHLPEGIYACGRVNGSHSFGNRLLDGQRAGSMAAAYAGFGTASQIDVPNEAHCPTHEWPFVFHPRGKEFVDFDEDLQLRDFQNAVQEGFDNIELLKRYSTVGMGPSQGKHSNMNALRLLARLTGKEPQQVGTTTARPFFHPVPMSHLAGRGFTPERVTPMHALHEQSHAQWMKAGDWYRPEYYRVAGRSRAECIRDEVIAVRNSVGIIDVSTLGKIEVIGPDAAELLERVYISRYRNMRTGMTRYAVMCDETGVVIDDGVVARLADNHFYFTTTTTGAASVYRELSRLNTIWGLDCGIVNLTGAHAAINLAGPGARKVLGKLTSGDLSPEAFPYLGVRDLVVSGIGARVMRVGFVGELGYEIHIPANYAAALWQALLAAGNEFGIRPFGVEAQRLLRLEKAHIIISQDTDGLTNPYEAGLDWAVKMEKDFFVGQKSLEIISRRPAKQKLVGFTLAPGNAGSQLQECHLVIHDGEIAGRITSIAHSPSLGCVIGLAFVPPQLAEIGTQIAFRNTDGELIPAMVAGTPFYDPDNNRQKEAR